MKYDCECVGGKIFLKTEKELPGWLNNELWGFLGFLDYGDEEKKLDIEHYPFGGNMVFARDLLEDLVKIVEEEFIFLFKDDCCVRFNYLGNAKQFVNISIFDKTNTYRLFNFKVQLAFIR